MRIALGLEYDGRGFCGWQSQRDACAIQDHLESALARLAGHPVRAIAAGRTDAGVHALCQVLHFDTMAERPPDAWVRGVNAHLPESVRVLWSRCVDDGFHARFSARARHYQYLLLNRAVAPAILAGKAGWFHAPLALDAMQRGAALLAGRHDFSAFRAAGCQARSPVKTMREAAVTQENDRFLFSFRADAFLHHQVRNMVGALIYVGKGRYPPEFIGELLAARDRRLAPPTFAPDGLYLAGVEYDVKWALPFTGRSLRAIFA